MRPTRTSGGWWGTRRRRKEPDLRKLTCAPSVDGTALRESAARSGPASDTLRVTFALAVTHARNNTANVLPSNSRHVRKDR